MPHSILGTEQATPEAIEQMAAHRRKVGDVRWAAYQNHDLGHYDLGGLRFLAIGPQCTFQGPPSRYPDTQHGLGWRYLWVGWVDLLDGGKILADETDVCRRCYSAAFLDRHDVCHSPECLSDRADR